MLHLPAHMVHGLAVLLDEVPLVHHQDAGLSGLVGQARHLGVLFRDALRRVDEDKAHVRPLNGHGGPQDAVALHPRLYFGLAPDAGGVDENEGPLRGLQAAVNGVPGGAGHFGDDGPLLPQNPVHQRGLSGVGLADYRHFYGVVLRGLRVLRRQQPDAGVQQVPGAVAVNGGHGDGLSQAQVVELVEIRVRGTGGVHFVHRQDHGFPALLQQGRHVLVCGGDARADVRHQYNDGGVLDGNLRLTAHEGEHPAVRMRLDAAGVHQDEGTPRPVRLPAHPVPGDAGAVLHNGQPPPDEFVKEHGFPHVGAAHNGDHGFQGRCLLSRLRRRSPPL